VALKSLGDAGEASGPYFAEADPVVRKAATLAKSGVVPTSELANLLVSLKKTGGWDGLTELIYNTAGAFNGFDQYGHFGRTLVTLTNCVNYEPARVGASGCVANFHGPNASESATTSTAALYSLLQQSLEGQTGGTGTEPGPAIGVGQGSSTTGSEAEGEGEAGISESSKTGGGTEPLLDYLLGP